MLIKARIGVPHSADSSNNGVSHKKKNVPHKKKKKKEKRKKREQPRGSHLKKKKIAKRELCMNKKMERRKQSVAAFV